MGSAVEVKPLGVIAMIDDDGELDWKVLAISLDDPLASTYDSVGIRHQMINAFGFDENY